MLTCIERAGPAADGLKTKMLSSVPSQVVVTDKGDRFHLLKLGLYPLATPPGRGVAASVENIELVMIEARSNSRRHYHERSDAVIYIVSGRGRLLLGTDVIEYAPQLKFAIPSRVMHGFSTDEDTVFLSIQTPHIIDPATGEVDIHYE